MHIPQRRGVLGWLDAMEGGERGPLWRLCAVLHPSAEIVVCGFSVLSLLKGAGSGGSKSPGGGRSSLRLPILSFQAARPSDQQDGKARVCLPNGLSHLSLTQISFWLWNKGLHF